MYMHCLHSLFCQLPNCNLFIQHVIYLYGETPLVNCGPRSILLNLYYHLLQALFTFCNHYFTSPQTNTFFPHYTSNPLLSANRWDWQPHCKLGQSILVMLCAGSTLLTDAGSAPYHKSASSNLRKWFLSPTGLIKPWFHTEGKLLLCSSYLPLGVSQLVLWDINIHMGITS
jgi:hypothetical protein